MNPPEIPNPFLRLEVEQGAADYLLAVLQTRPRRLFPNRERWVRQATWLGEWHIKAPRTWTPGPKGGLWTPKLVLAA